jgi:cyanophycinase
VGHGHEPACWPWSGGSEWTEGCTFDATLLAASGGTDVVVLPTAAAYQHPERVVLRAAEWFADLGAQVEGLMVVDRASAEDPAWPPPWRRPLHLPGRRLAAPPQGGAQGVGHLRGAAPGLEPREPWWPGSAAGAMVLTDPMVDPRGGALTLGLGLVDQLAVVPHFGDEHEDAHGQKLERTVAMAPAGAARRGHPGPHGPDPGRRGAWTYEGAAEPVVFVDGGRTEGLDALKA